MALQMPLPWDLLERPRPEHQKPDPELNPTRPESFFHEDGEHRKRPVSVLNPWRRLRCSICGMVAGRNVIKRLADGTHPVVCSDCLDDLAAKLTRVRES